jgi:hypothetical protein
MHVRLLPRVVRRITERDTLVEYTRGRGNWNCHAPVSISVLVERVKAYRFLNAREALFRQ